MGKQAGSQASYPGGWKSRFHLSSSDFYRDGRDQKHPTWRLWFSSYKEIISQSVFCLKTQGHLKVNKTCNKVSVGKKGWNKHNYTCKGMTD